MKTSKWIINNTQNLANKTVVITGSTSGLGLHTSKIIATLGANLIFLNRDETKSQALKDELQKQNPKIKIDIIKTDILSKFKNLDDLIENISSVGYLPEGAVACKYVYQIARKHNLKLTICNGLYRILNREIEPEDFLTDLLMRG